MEDTGLTTFGPAVRDVAHVSAMTVTLIRVWLALCFLAFVQALTHGILQKGLVTFSRKLTPGDTLDLVQLILSQGLPLKRALSSPR